MTFQAALDPLKIWEEVHENIEISSPGIREWDGPTFGERLSGRRISGDPSTWTFWPLGKMRCILWWLRTVTMGLCDHGPVTWPHCASIYKMVRINSTYLIELLWGLNELIHVKPLEQSLAQSLYIKNIYISHALGNTINSHVIIIC
jgi:hypothetical protein